MTHKAHSTPRLLLLSLLLLPFVACGGEEAAKSEPVAEEPEAADVAEAEDAGPSFGVGTATFVSEGVTYNLGVTRCSGPDAKGNFEILAYETEGDDPERRPSLSIRSHPDPSTTHIVFNTSESMVESEYIELPFDGASLHYEGQLMGARWTDGEGLAPHVTLHLECNGGAAQ